MSINSPMRHQAIYRRYQFEFDVGEWPYGSVQVVRDRRTGALKTCKSVSRHLLQDPDSTVQRLRKLSELQLPQVSSFTDIVEDADCIFLLSDRCPGGDLNDWMDQLGEFHWLQEETVAVYIAQALVALAYCHARRVYHHDLSPASLMLTSKLPEAMIRVGDFGVQAVLDPNHALARQNPSPYMAPELLSDTSRKLGDGAPDLWSIGAIARQLLVGSKPGAAPPWHESSGFLRGNERDEWAERSPASQDFVARLLQPAGHRPTAAKMLQHPWLRACFIPRGIRGWVGFPQDLEQRVCCYMAGVLLAPALLLHGDMSRLATAFRQADGDYDGLVLRSVAHELLQEHSCHESTVDTFGEDEIEDALEIADVKGTGVFGFCGLVVAAMLAKRLPRAVGVPNGSSRAAETVPVLASAFFEVYGKAHQTSLETCRLTQQLRNDSGRVMEQHAGVDFERVLSTFAAHDTITRESFAALLSKTCGRGTPLSFGKEEAVCEELREDVCDDSSDSDSESSVAPTEGLNGILASVDPCGFLPQTRSLLKKLMDLQCVHCVTAS